MDPALIGLDWGISSFRAYALAPDGRVLARHESEAGILGIAAGGFEAALRREIGGWLRPSLPLLAAGMVGSRQGWLEAPYVPAPAGAAELVAGLARLRLGDGTTVHFVPGVDRVGDDGVPDVMRGEETQIVGAVAGNGPALLVLPGSHSKWARAEGGRIAWFATFMTGELFQALKGHTILGRLMAPGGGFDAAAFDAGVAYARSEAAEAGGLLKRLFSARTLGLFGRLPESGLADYLSGLLIGAEIVEAGRCLGAVEGPVMAVGGEALARRYVRALEAAGFAVAPAPPEPAAIGLARIGRAAGLLQRQLEGEP